MKNSFYGMLIILSLSFLLSNCSSNQKQEDKQSATLTPEQLVKKGEYLVTVMGCHDCHSPKQVGPQGATLIPELLLSGYPSDRALKNINNDAIRDGWVLMNEDLTSAAGPWGVSFSANLTSDPTGIGNWTEENFKRALTQGKFKGIEGSRMLLPPMPWFNFTDLSDDDVSAIFAYLKSTKPVKNIVPQPIPPDMASK